LLCLNCTPLGSDLSSQIAMVRPRRQRCRPPRSRLSGYSGSPGRRSPHRGGSARWRRRLLEPRAKWRGKCRIEIHGYRGEEGATAAANSLVPTGSTY
jgi:hypothetical protein